MWQQELVCELDDAKADRQSTRQHKFPRLAADGLDQELELPILLMGHRLTFHPLDQTV